MFEKSVDPKGMDKDLVFIYDPVGSYVPSPKSLEFRRRSVGCFSRRSNGGPSRTGGKCRYLDHNGRASNAEKQPTGRGPEGCVENGSAASLLVSHVSIQICSFLRRSGSDRLADDSF